MYIINTKNKIWYIPNIKNLYLGLKYQLPIKRFYKNFIITKHGLGLFSMYSHFRRDTEQTKVMYNTYKSAKRSADTMGKKHNKYFSVYKCIYCNGFHIGKNRDNK